MKKKFRTILIIAIVALLLIAANITEIAVVFDATTSNATKYGEEWLEVIGNLRLKFSLLLTTMKNARRLSVKRRSK